MESILANVAGRTRRAMLDGKQYIVAPLTLIVPGVLSGSKGALYYPESEVAKNPEVWNNTPIVVYHPTKNGQNVSATAPGILDKSGIGHIRKPQVTDKTGKLAAEGWFDIERTRQIDNRVLQSLERGQSIELSTGLFTENDLAPRGSVDPKGRPYEYIARNYRPDHLAILPDQVGACSINDGCGVLVNRHLGGSWLVSNGGIGSGNFGHSGRKGTIGGSTAKKTIEMVLSKAGFTNVGRAGGDYTIYKHKTTDSLIKGHHVYVFDDGHWEHHNRDEQFSDSTHLAQARGNRLEDLEEHLSSINTIQRTNNWQPLDNQFCPTGKGGKVDATCGKGGGARAEKSGLKKTAEVAGKAAVGTTKLAGKAVVGTAKVSAAILKATSPYVRATASGMYAGLRKLVGAEKADYTIHAILDNLANSGVNSLDRAGLRAAMRQDRADTAPKIFAFATLGTGPLAVKAVKAGIKHSPKAFSLMMSAFKGIGHAGVAIYKDLKTTKSSSERPQFQVGKKTTLNTSPAKKGQEEQPPPEVTHLDLQEDLFVHSIEKLHALDQFLVQHPEEVKKLGRAIDACLKIAGKIKGGNKLASEDLTGNRYWTPLTNCECGGKCNSCKNKKDKGEEDDDGEETANKGQPSDRADVSPDKACKILKDGTIRGHDLSKAQRGMFGAICGKRSKKMTSNRWQLVDNAFCATGAGGGIDPTCGKDDDSAAPKEPEEGSKAYKAELAKMKALGRNNSLFNRGNFHPKEWDELTEFQQELWNKIYDQNAETSRQIKAREKEERANPKTDWKGIAREAGTTALLIAAMPWAFKHNSAEPSMSTNGWQPLRPLSNSAQSQRLGTPIRQGFSFFPDEMDGSTPEMDDVDRSPHSLLTNDDIDEEDMTDNDDDEGDATTNANPRGCNQYKACDESAKAAVHKADKASEEANVLSFEHWGSSDAGAASEFADELSNDAIRYSGAENPHRNNHKDSVGEHLAAAKQHGRAARMHKKSGNLDVAGAHQDAATAHKDAAKAHARAARLWQPPTTNRNWSQSKRDKTPSHDFAGPHESFPIVDQDDVDSAAHLIGKSRNPETTKRRIMAIARKKGLRVPTAWELTNNVGWTALQTL